MATNPDYLAAMQLAEQQKQQQRDLTTITQFACPRKELRNLVSQYADDIMNDVYVEAGNRLDETSRFSGSFHLPARSEKRNSLGLDRNSIGEAQIGWLVEFKWKNDIIATGLVRQFVPRETKCDLVLVRLFKELDVEPLTKQIDLHKESTIELKVRCQDPILFKRCKRFFFLKSRLERLKLSPVAMELIFGDLDKAQCNVIWPPPLDLNADMPLPKRLSFKLNDEQNYCLRRAISRQATIIDGVVGSGKSHLAACIAYCLAYERNLKVLICSPHRGTADLISKLLIRKIIFIDDDEHQMSVVRVTSDKTEKTNKKASISKAPRSHDISGKLDDLASVIIRERYRKRLEKIKNCLPKKPSDINRETQITRILDRCMKIACKKTRNDADAQVLQRADIVCCTLSQANRSMVYNHKYDVLIVDDTHLATDIDLMGPLMQPGLKQIILLGESLFISNKNSQLINCDDDQESSDDELQKLFYQIVKFSGYCAKLTEQYRAHENLLEFANQYFYDNKLSFNWRSNQRFELLIAVSRYLDWMPQVDSMTTIFATSSFKLIKPTVEKIIDKLITVEKVPKSAIIIISTDKYHIRDIEIKGVKVRSVLDAIGLEFDFVILSCDQWSHKPNRLSHEMDPNYILNERAFYIALTRARLGMFIVAEQRLLNLSLRKNILNRLSVEFGLIDQDITEENLPSGGNNQHCSGWQKLVDHHDRMGTIFSSHRLLSNQKLS